MKKLGALLLLGTLGFGPSVFAYRSIHTCQSRTTIGHANVNHRGFAQSIRYLRAQCRAAAHHYDAAEVVWVGRGTYECQVGSFCGIGGN